MNVHFKINRRIKICNIVNSTLNNKNKFKIAHTVTYGKVKVIFLTISLINRKHTK